MCPGEEAQHAVMMMMVEKTTMWTILMRRRRRHHKSPVGPFEVDGVAQHNDLLLVRYRDERSVVVAQL